MKNIELNGLVIDGSFYLGLRVGLTKYEIEKILGKRFGTADIETPDLDSYYIELKTGVVLSILFDKEDICYEINLDIEENKDSNLIVQFEQQIERIYRTIPFEKLVATILKLNVEWEFDNKRVYLQTVCIRLKNGLRLYYAFGNKSNNDYGLFSIKSILETHRFSAMPHV